MTRALWGACEGRARSAGGVCRLVRETVRSLEELEASQGPYAAVIVAAGAAVGALPEIGASSSPADPKSAASNNDVHI